MSTDLWTGSQADNLAANDMIDIIQELREASNNENHDPSTSLEPVEVFDLEVLAILSSTPFDSDLALEGLVRDANQD